MAIISRSHSSLVGKPSFLSGDTYGSLLLLCSAFGFTCGGAFLKLAVAKGVPAMELAFLRGLLQGLVVVLAMFFWRTDPVVGSEDPTCGKPLIYEPFGDCSVRKVVIARGLVGGFGFVMFYYTMAVLPLGDATALLSLSPIITVLFSNFVGDPVRPAVLILAVMSITGTVMIAQPSFLFPNGTLSSTSPWGYCTAIGGSCCAAAVALLVRQAGKTGVHTLQLLFSWCLFGVMYATLVQAVMGQRFFPAVPSDPVTILYIFLMVAFSSGAHFLMDYAGRFVHGSLTSILSSTRIVWGYALDILVFRDAPSLLTILGAIIVLGSVALVTLVTGPAQVSRETQVLLQSSEEEKLQTDDKTASYGSVSNAA